MARAIPSILYDPRLLPLRQSTVSPSHETVTKVADLGIRGSLKFQRDGSISLRTCVHGAPDETEPT